MVSDKQKEVPFLTNTTFNVVKKIRKKNVFYTSKKRVLVATNSLYKKIRESHFYKKLVFTTTQQEITYSKLIIKTKEQRQLRGSGVFIANFENISRFFSSVSINNFEQINPGWKVIKLMLRLLFKSFKR